MLAESLSHLKEKYNNSFSACKEDSYEEIQLSWMRIDQVQAPNGNKYLLISSSLAGLGTTVAIVFGNDNRRHIKVKAAYFTTEDEPVNNKLIVNHLRRDTLDWDAESKIVRMIISNEDHPNLYLKELVLATVFEIFEGDVERPIEDFHAGMDWLGQTDEDGVNTLKTFLQSIQQ